ncbi:DNA-3-methyladenine glycosylase family protein [Caproiciproducens sp. LBM24188]|nr:DNA-3-methyladenine glycosylase 2 family protein [Oscillospiraceae bacterium]HHV31015.1 DNA-3-methyladenine glycosylase 2 family protein [Clostridiales bacterium]
MDYIDLAQTLECGQCFRWDHQPDGSYTGIASGRTLRVSEENLPDIIKDPFWNHYFDFDLNYTNIRAELAKKDPVLARAAEYAPGMRILNQEPWEALCSFILSQNNNIPRIRGLVARLCGEFGETLEQGGHAFPTPETLAELTEADLAPVRCGFRARYLIDAAKKVASGEIDLEQVRRLPLDEARAKLMTIVGVGPKVADCALLYGLHRLDAFPMDVWMKRAMRVLFPGRTPDFFGPYAGIAQQYIFHYSRMNPQLFAEDEAAS